MKNKVKSKVYVAKLKPHILKVIAALRFIQDQMTKIKKRIAKAGTKDPQPAAERPHLEFKPAYSKLVDVMLCLLHEAERLKMVVTTFELVKTVFIADRQHLNAYGRPITYDRYLAMKNGPVGHAFYNMLREEKEWLSLTGPVRWKRRPSKAPRRRYWADKDTIYEYSDPERPTDVDNVLSESDVEELEKALREVKKLGVSGVWKKTHDDPAYVAAWDGNGESKSYPINPILLFDNPCDDDLENLMLYAENNR